MDEYQRCTGHVKTYVREYFCYHRIYKDRHVNYDKQIISNNTSFNILLDLSERLIWDGTRIKNLRRNFYGFTQQIFKI